MPEGKNYAEDKIMAELAAGSITVGQLHDSCVRVMSVRNYLPKQKSHSIFLGSLIMTETNEIYF